MSRPQRPIPHFVAAAARAFARDERGAAAIEFGVVGLALTTLLMAILQFALFFLSQISLHGALAEAASGTQTATQATRSSMTTMICARVILADNCATRMKLETAPLSTYAAGAQPVTGATFSAGAVGEAMLVRAEVPIVIFVPGLPPLSIRGAAFYVRS